MKLTYKEYLSIALILAIIGVLGVLFQRPWQSFGSVEVGNQYLSTTTPTVADRTNLCPARTGMASSTTGVLGSVSITGYGAGELMLVDATTSIATSRAITATSSLMLAHFPVTGTTTVHFDTEFKYGLFVDYTSGVGTSTITYRCEG